MGLGELNGIQEVSGLILLISTINRGGCCGPFSLRRTGRCHIRLAFHPAPSANPARSGTAQNQYIEVDAYPVILVHVDSFMRQLYDHLFSSRCQRFTAQPHPMTSRTVGYEAIKRLSSSYAACADLSRCLRAARSYPARMRGQRVCAEAARPRWDSQPPPRARPARRLLCVVTFCGFQKRLALLQPFAVAMADDLFLADRLHLQEDAVLPVHDAVQDMGSIAGLSVALGSLGVRHSRYSARATMRCGSSGQVGACSLVVSASRALAVNAVDVAGKKRAAASGVHGDVRFAESWQAGAGSDAPGGFKLLRRYDLQVLWSRERLSPPLIPGVGQLQRMPRMLAWCHGLPLLAL